MHYRTPVRCLHAVVTYNRRETSKWQFCFHRVATSTDTKTEHPVYSNILNVSKGCVYSHICWIRCSRTILKKAIQLLDADDTVRSQSWPSCHDVVRRKTPSDSHEDASVAEAVLPLNARHYSTASCTHTHAIVSCLCRVLINFQVFIAAPMLVQVSYIMLGPKYERPWDQPAAVTWSSAIFLWKQNKMVATDVYI